MYISIQTILFTVAIMCLYCTYHTYQTIKEYTKELTAGDGIVIGLGVFLSAFAIITAILF